MKFYIIGSLVLLVFYGCSHIVGGNCNYQSTQGYAVIKSKKADVCIVDFFPDHNVWKEWKQIDDTYNIEITCSDKIKISKSYSAIYKKATHASCTPTILILSKEIK